jgi:hypothetical protein
MSNRCKACNGQGVLLDGGASVGCLICHGTGEKFPWVNDNGSTNVEGFLEAYSKDQNVFWRAGMGHIQNVLDALIDERASQESI